MQDKFERLIKMVYKKWKLGAGKVQQAHPDEEDLACFLEGRLSKEETNRIRAHLVTCDNCIEAVALNLKLKPTEIKEVPAELLSQVKNSLDAQSKPSALEIVLRFKERLLELLSTTGDILVGQELIPAPILRSRSIKDFKDEVTILKDFRDVRVEAKIENKGAGAFNLIILVKQKQTQEIIKDLRVTLLKDDLELESYLTTLGCVTFEHVLLGKYRVEISTLENKLASILLDIKV